MNKPSSSYLQILRATSLIGAASAINIVFQIIRVKVLAVLLGPVGMGVFGVLHSILNTASSLAGMGINSSAVRQIAEARGIDDDKRIGEVIYVLRALTIGLSVVGAAMIFLLREVIALWTFGDSTYSAMVGWLSVGVLFTVASQSFSALLQAYRRIGDQARLQVWSGILATILGIGFVAWLGMDGVIVFVVVVPLVVTLLAWRYTKYIGVKSNRLSRRSFLFEAQLMITMGIAIVASGVLQGCALLALRSEITQRLGIEATGLFQAAWSLSFIYMSFVLDAMGKDYYPHLTGYVADREKTVQLIREQVNVALILISPLIIGMIAFAPLVIEILYAQSFQGAVPLIQWMGIGNFFKLLSWPLGFLLLAQAHTKVFVTLEIVWVVSFLSIAWVFSESFGLTAVGIGFTVAYCVYLTILYGICRRSINFSLNQKSLRIVVGYGILVIIAFASAKYGNISGYIFGLFCFAVASYLSFKQVKLMIRNK